MYEPGLGTAKVVTTEFFPSVLSVSLTAAFGTWVIPSTSNRRACNTTLLSADG